MGRPSARTLAARKARRDLEEQRARMGIVVTEEWGRFRPGHRVRLKNHGTGQRKFVYRAHFRSERRGTEWVDVYDRDAKRVRPVRPDALVKCRNQPDDPESETPKGGSS